ncbi:MAG: hypothetical protein ABUT20_02855 [Bacteroidota bacterium]
MKKKIYLYVSIVFFVLAISVLLYTLSQTGLFDKSKIMVKAQSCDTCADYEVIMGSSKLSGKFPDNVKEKNASQVFITGAPNPDNADFTKTYDYYIIKGEVTGVKQVAANEPWNPVITVSNWQHITLSNGWPFVILVIILLIISIRYYLRFIDVNKTDIMESSLRSHSGQPD